MSQPREPLILQMKRPTTAPHPRLSAPSLAGPSALAAAPRRLRRGFALLWLSATLLLVTGPFRVLGAPDQPAPAPTPAPGRNLPKRVYHAVRLAGPPPKVDGKLDDPCWTQGDWQGDFIQREPHEGRPGSEPTQLKILYDDRYVYVAIRAFDSELAKLPRLRGNRDEFIGDGVGVAFDSYLDRRTGFEFDLSSGGSKIDGIDYNAGWDGNWNAVWDGKVGTEKGAWTAEFRIPLSQLRYSNKREQIWGLHSWRWINRLQEESDWQFIPMDNPGFVYSFGELRGIRDLPPYRRLELLPYTLIKTTSLQKEASNPYRQGAETTWEAGLDAKVGLATNFTADLTVNPDFGQVEADPSEINLTTYETFLTEKRPFFLEGKSILEFPIDENDLLFYSRRIGHVPLVDPATDGFKQSPESTRILSAVKLTGKTPEGLSVGVLHSLTDREMVRITENGVERRQTAEPATNFGLARVQQDIDKGNTLVGGIVTDTRRNLPADLRDVLSRNAYTAGVDYLHYWGDRSYVLDLKVLGSRVEGSPAAMEALMLAPVHNYQRPDATHLGVVTDATHLDGTGGRIRIGKESNGKLRYSGSLDWRSPGFELNDLGYLKAADVIIPAFKVDYVDTQATGHRRRLEYIFKQTNQYDFAGTPLRHDAEAEGVLTLMNNSAGWIVGDYSTESLDTRVLRGGPAVAMPPRAGLWLGGQTDSSLKHQYHLDIGHTVSVDGHSHYTEIVPSVSARVLDHINLQAKVSYSHDVEDFQYAGTATTAGGNRYIMGRMNQQTLSTTVRFDINLTPELSLSYYGSPFASTGRFSRFKLVTDPRAPKYDGRFRRLDATTTFDAASNRYRVADPGGAFTFANPDFSWRALNSNLVLRWEYKTGSTVYVVWSQGRTNGDFTGDFSAGSDYRRLFSAHPDNTILVKFNYWFSL